MAFIDDIVKFHSFSKSTVRTGLTLGEAVNPSGHTVTSKQVRTDDIPWFVNSFQGDETSARTWAAKNATAARHNDILYYGAEFKVGFTAPKCLIYVSKQEVDGKLVDLPADQCGWQTFDLNSATTLKNADGKDVIAIHKNAKVEYVDGNNNAATNSNQQSLFVRRADGTLLDHFVAATDQIVGGQPSLGYSAVVSVSGKAIDEGEGSGNYIGNTYAGIIHFHSARTNTKANDGSVNGITVTCFEYIGDKLDTTLTDIDAKISQVVGDAFEGAVASVTADSNTKNLGLTVTDGANPVITVTPGTIAESKLVTGSTVKTYIDTTALATGGSINTAIKNAIDAIPEVQNATTEVAGVVTISDNNAIATTATSTAAATVAAVAATRTAIETIAGNAQSAAEEAANAAKAAQTAAQNAQSAVETAANNASTSASAAAQSATAASQSATSASNAETAAKAAQTAAQGSATSASQSASAAQTAQQQATASAQSAAQAAADAKAAKEFVETTAQWEAGSDDTLGDFTSTTKDGVVTGTTVKTVADEVLTLAKSYSDSFHTTSLDYVVLGDNEALPRASAETLGKIYLVKEGNLGFMEPAIDALSGSYVEYMTRKIGDGETATYTWEKIGTTAADLSAYAKTSDLNATNVGSGAVKVSQTNGVVSSVTVETEGLVVVDEMTQDSSIKNVTTSETALITAADALEAIKLAKPEKYVASVSGFGADGSLVTNLNGTGVHIMDGRGPSITANDLWGTTTTMDQLGNIIISHDWVTNPNTEPGTAWNTSITKVEKNKAYEGNTLVGNIQTDMIKNGYTIFATSALTSFNSDLDNLINGTGMFQNTKITYFNNDMRNLVDGTGMFSNSTISSISSRLDSLTIGSSMFNTTKLTSFSDNLSKLINGSGMFYCSTIASFNSNLDNLINGNDMFNGCPELVTFDVDLGNLVEGSNMFKSTSLTSFDNDLSNLNNSKGMFVDCNKLTSFNSDLSNLVEGYSTFAASSLTSFNGDLSSLKNGGFMFSDCVNLTSFNGDLSSLIDGYGMFYNTSLDVDSVEVICDVLPNWKENKIKTYNFNQITKEYTASEWNGSSYIQCPILLLTNGRTAVQGLTGISPTYAKTITIQWNDISILTEAERNKVLNLMVETANEKGWTFLTNTGIDSDGSVSPTQIMAADGTIQHYIYAIKVEADEKTAKFVDANGKYWNVGTAECIIGPNVKYWELFATKEDAITTWGLSEYTYIEPTEEA